MREVGAEVENETRSVKEQPLVQSSVIGNLVLITLGGERGALDEVI